MRSRVRDMAARRRGAAGARSALRRAVLAAALAALCGYAYPHGGGSGGDGRMERVARRARLVSPGLPFAQAHTFRACVDCSGLGTCRSDGVCVCDPVSAGPDCSDVAAGLTTFTSSTLSYTTGMLSQYGGCAAMAWSSTSEVVYAAFRDGTVNAYSVDVVDVVLDSSDAGLDLAAAATPWDPLVVSRGLPTGALVGQARPSAENVATAPNARVKSYVGVVEAPDGSALYVGLNLYTPGTSTYSYRIVKMYKSGTGSTHQMAGAGDGTYGASLMAFIEEQDYYLDAMTVDRAGDVVYKLSKMTGAALESATSLQHVLRVGHHSTIDDGGDGDDVDIDTTTEEVLPMQYYFECAKSGQISGRNFVFFAGQKYRFTGGTGADNLEAAIARWYEGTYDPAAAIELKPTFSQTWGVGYSSSERTCGSATDTQKSVTFSTMVTYQPDSSTLELYLGTTSSERTAAGCILKVVVDQNGNMDHVGTVILNPERDERDMRSGAIDYESSVLYMLTSDPDAASSRIIKVDIGDAFVPLGSFEAAAALSPLGAVAVPVRDGNGDGLNDVHGVVAGSDDSSDASQIRRLGTMQVTAVDPVYGPSAVDGVGTSVTITGSGFYEPAEGTAILCRFGSAAETVGTWQADTNTVLCVAPDASTTGTTNFVAGYAPVTLSFDNGLTYTGDGTYYRYYDAPTVVSMSPSSIVRTGLDSSSSVYTLSLYGGPYFDAIDVSGDSLLRCKFLSGSADVVVAATYMSSTLIQCPSPSFSTAGTRNVSVSMNARDENYHLATGVELELYDLPNTLQVDAANGAQYSYRCCSPVPSDPADAAVHLDSIVVNVVDSSGTLVSEASGLVNEVQVALTAPTVAGGSPMDVLFSGDETAKTTSDGSVQFDMTMDGAPLIGTYTVEIAAGALGTASQWLATDPSLTVSGTTVSVNILPGDAYALQVEPASVTLSAAASVDLGFFSVRVVDLAGNPLDTLDTSVRVVTASLSRGTSYVGDASAAWTGADFDGTTSSSTSSGHVQFDDLRLVVPRQSDSALYTAGTYTLSFADAAGALSPTSVSVTVTQSSPAFFEISSQQDSQNVDQVTTRAMPSVTLQAYDGGNNAIAADPSKTYTIAASSTTLTFIAGSTTTAGMEVDGSVVFDALRVEPPISAGRHNVTFSSAGFEPTVATFDISLGSADHLSIVLPTSAGAVPTHTYSSAALVELEAFRVVARDVGGNDLLTDDTEERTITLSASGGLGLSGDLSPRMTDGEIVIGDIYALAPKVGTYTLTVSTAGVDAATLDLVIVTGDAVALVVVNSPRLTYAADEYVDLDPFEIALVDDGNNIVSSLPLFRYSFETALKESDFTSAWAQVPNPCTDATGCPRGTNETIHTDAREELASESGAWMEGLEDGTYATTMYSEKTTTRTFNATHERVREVTRVFNLTAVETSTYEVMAMSAMVDDGFEPYMTGLDVGGSGHGSNLPLVDVLTVDSERNGTLSIALGTGVGTSTYDALQLFRPKIGEHTIVFQTKNDAIAPTSITLTATTGAPHQLGIPYFVRSQFASVARTAIGGYTDEYIEATCSDASSCQRDRTLRTHVLDAAGNFVGDADEVVREVRMTLVGNEALLVRCTSTQGEMCTASVLAERYLSTDATLGVAGVENGAIMGVDGVYGPLIGTYVVEITSDGLRGVRYPFEVTPGPAARLKVIEPASLVYQSSKHTRLQTIIINVLDSGGNLLRGCCERGEDCCDADREVIATARDDTVVIRSGDLRGINSTDTSDGAGDFTGAYRSIYLNAPLVGDHEIIFTSDGLEETSFVVSVLPGDAVRLGIVSPVLDSRNRIALPYTAVPDMALGTIVLRGVDFAGNTATGVGSTIVRATTGTGDGGRPMRHRMVCTDCNAGTLDRPMGPPASSPGEVEFSGLSLLVPEACNSAYEGEDGYSRPYCYSLTFVEESGLLEAVTLTFQVDIGSPYRLHINDTFLPQDAIEGDLPYDLVTVEQSSATVQLRTVPVLVYDGGDNYLGNMDVDPNGGASMERDIFIARVDQPDEADTDPTTQVALSMCPSYADFDTKSSRGVLSPDSSPYTSGVTENGYHLFRQIRLESPPEGAYVLRFYEVVPEPEEEGEEMREPLLPFDLPVTILPGYPTRVEVSELDSLLKKEIPSHERTRLPTVDVRLYDAGDNFISGYGLDQESTEEFPYADEQRNVSIRVTRFVDVDGVETRYQANASVLFDEGATLPDHGMARAKDGIARFGDLYLYKPLAGTYYFIVESTCDFDFCPNAPGGGNLVLETTDALALTVVPGEPVVLTWGRTPPKQIENTFTLSSLPTLELRDAAGSVCTQENTFATVRLHPPALELRGNVAPVIAGVGTLHNLRVVGDRGGEYDLIFEVPALDIELAYGPVRVLSCAEVKPNSIPDAHGGCMCRPGYTEDINHEGATGHTVGLNSTATFFDLYSNVVHERESNAWLGALQPYGVCAPCKNGFYKPFPGAHPCTACPPNMDTSFDAGRPALSRLSASGEMLFGELGHSRKEACHCKAEPWLSVELPGDSYYADVADMYLCHPCPYGGICNGLGISEIKSAPGRWRTSRSSIDFRRCPNPETCLGGEDSECLVGNGTGHTGVTCAACIDGFAYPSAPNAVPLMADFANTQFCTSCMPAYANAILFLLAAAVKVAVVLLICRAATRTDSATVMHWKTLLNYLQTVSNPNDIALRWPASVSAYFVFARTLGTPSLQNNAADCLLGLDHYGWTGIYLAIPVVLVLAAVAYHHLVSKRRRYLKAREHQRRKYLESNRAGMEDGEADAQAGADIAGEQGDGSGHNGSDERMGEGEAGWDPSKRDANTLDRAVCAVLVGLYYSHTTISRYLFGLIRCRSFDEGSYLMADLSIPCGTGAHGAWMFALIVFSAVYVVGIPFLTFAVLGRQGNLRDVHTRYQFGMYYLGYSPELWFWDIEIIARKLALTLVASVMIDDPSYAGYICIWIMQVSLVVHLVIDPCKNSRFERLEMLSQVVNLITYNMGILYYNGVSELASHFLAVVIWGLNVGVWVHFFKCMREELHHESKLAMIRRAKADIEREDAIRRLNIAGELHDLKPTLRGLPKRGAEQLRVAFADNTMTDIIATKEVPDLRLKHLQLSLNLENMRNNWRKTKLKGVSGARRASIEDDARQRQRMLVPAERWRQRRREESASAELEAAAAAAGNDEDEDGGESRRDWRERMADPQWRVTQRLKYRLAGGMAGADSRRATSDDAGAVGDGSGAEGDPRTPPEQEVE